MKISLRDRFHSPDSHKLDSDPLIRLGALYRLAQKDANTESKGDLLKLLEEPTNGDSGLSDSEQLLFLLHTAVLLAQNNSFEGVQWILNQIVTAPTQELRSLAVTALRNCTQFPFAVLLAQSIELSQSMILKKEILSLMETSEDDLYAISQKSNEEQRQRLLDLASRIEAIRTSHRSNGREIVLGTVINRPVQKDFGYRYTGFVSSDGTGVSSLVVPYDMADVINRDDRHARQNVWRLLGQPGHRAIFVFNSVGDPEIQAMYVLPYAVLSGDEIQMLISRLAIEARGLDIAVVVGLWLEQNRTRYRLLTANGRNMVQTYRADEQRIGNCFLIHSLNSKPLSTRYKLQESSVANIVRRFADNPEIDLAVHLNSWKNNNLLATRNGKTLIKHGELPTDHVFVVEESGRDVFQLPGGSWQSTDRSKVLQSFFSKCPDSSGAIIEVFQHQDGSSRARAIRATSGEQKLLRVDQPLQPGTLVYWNTNDKGESYATIIADQRILDGCSYCFGTSYRVCEECEGKGKIICPDCDGSRFVECPDCEGTGRDDCGHCEGSGEVTITCPNCNGSGEWQGECRNCEGTGTYTGECKVCGGSGQYADSGRTCKKCSGEGSFTADCRRCSGTGVVSGTCKRCDGRGQWTERCKTCKGSGRWDCGTCHGKGEVPCGCGYGKVVCDECNGARITPCDCRGRTQGTIVPA